MGQNLAHNFASCGVRVVVYNRTHRRLMTSFAGHGGEGDFQPAGSLEELVQKLAKPRAVLSMFKARSPVEKAIHYDGYRRARGTQT